MKKITILFSTIFSTLFFIAIFYTMKDSIIAYSLISLSLVTSVYFFIVVIYERKELEDFFDGMMLFVFMAPFVNLIGVFVINSLALVNNILYPKSKVRYFSFITK